jgi:hypothetical protein
VRGGDADVRVDELWIDGSKVRKVLGLGLLFAMTAGVAHAQGGGRPTGTWDIVLTVRDCTTGKTRATIRELATFSHGGTMISSTTGFPQATLRRTA